MTTPRLKSLDCILRGDHLVISFDPKSRVELDDRSGQVRALLELLQQGTRTVTQLQAELTGRNAAVSSSEIEEAVATLDALGWLEDACAPPLLNAGERERYASNLAFFDAFTSLQRSREALQHALLCAHVVVLGAGGLGSSVIQNLAGLGVGRVTIVDYDTIELKNLGRQFTYTESQIGLPKVEHLRAWTAAFNSGMDVRLVNQELTARSMIDPLLEGADLVVAAIDHPAEIDLWVNSACVGAGVPFIRGGLSFTQALYWSVDPGVSACRQCLETFRAGQDDADLFTSPVLMRRESVNRGIGPVAGLLGALVAMEAVRYLTAIAPPAAAGAYQLIDFGGDCGASRDPWPRDPACPVCSEAPRRRSTEAPMTGFGESRTTAGINR